MYNKSKTYLLPLVSELIHFEKDFIKYIKNTYMYVQNDNTPYLCLLHDFSFKNPEFTAYEHRLTSNDLFVKHIDLDNQVLYVFEFPKDYIQEYYSLLDSKYSEFGSDAKELILKFWSDIYQGNSEAIPVLVAIKQILYKDTKLREKLQRELKVVIDENQELGEEVNVEKETFIM